MTNNELPPKPQRDVIREVDWLAVAPWLLVLRAVGATIGWPLVVGVIGVTTLGWSDESVRLVRTANPSEVFSVDGAMTLLSPKHITDFGDVERWGRPSWTPAFRHLGWMLLGILIIQFAAARLCDRRPTSVVKSVWRLARYVPRVLGAVAILAVTALVCLLALWGLCALTWQPLQWPLVGFAATAAALPLSLVLLMLVFAAPLIVSAVVIDDSDPFDAVSRTVAYVFQKPGSLAACLVLGWIGYLASAVAINWLVRVSTVLTSGFSDSNPTMLYIVTTGFFPAYFYCAGVATYLVMRRLVDGQPMDEIA